MIIIRKALIFAFVYVLCQLLLMLIAYLVFGINLFEVDNTVHSKLVEELSLGELKWFVFFNQIVGLLLPALIFLWIMYQSKFPQLIDLNVPSRPELSLLTLGALVFSFPLIQYLAELNDLVPVSAWLQEAAGEIEDQMMRIIKMENRSQLVANLLLIALLPAISEELFFRGMIQKELIRHMKNVHIAIILAAIIFSAFHMQFDGFLPRFGLGLLLGYSYYFTRSIFIPFLMHMTNNAIMVVTVYFRSADQEQVIQEGEANSNIMLVIISLIVVVYVFRIIKVKSSRNGNQ